jgi:hypothetical protein
MYVSFTDILFHLTRSFPFQCCLDTEFPRRHSTGSATTTATGLPGALPCSNLRQHAGAHHGPFPHPHLHGTMVIVDATPFAFPPFCSTIPPCRSKPTSAVKRESRRASPTECAAPALPVLGPRAPRALGPLPLPQSPRVRYGASRTPSPMSAAHPPGGPHRPPRPRCHAAHRDRLMVDASTLGLPGLPSTQERPRRSAHW